MIPKTDQFFYDADLGYLKFAGHDLNKNIYKFKTYDKLQYGRWVQTKSLCELSPEQFNYKQESGDLKEANSPL